MGLSTEIGGHVDRKEHRLNTRWVEKIELKSCILKRAFNIQILQMYRINLYDATVLIFDRWINK